MKKRTYYRVFLGLLQYKELQENMSRFRPFKGPR
jgi:hypothetical protein